MNRALGGSNLISELYIPNIQRRLFASYYHFQVQIEDYVLIRFSESIFRINFQKEKCNNLCTIDHSITSLPEVFTVGVVWENADATLSEIETMLNMISWQVRLKKK